MRRSLALVPGRVFSIAVLVGFGLSAAIAKDGGGDDGGCYYRCDCAGNPLRCCPTPLWE